MHFIYFGTYFRTRVSFVGRLVDRSSRDGNQCNIPTLRLHGSAAQKTQETKASTDVLLNASLSLLTATYFCYHNSLTIQLNNKPNRRSVGTSTPLSPLQRYDQAPQILCKFLRKAKGRHHTNLTCYQNDATHRSSSRKVLKVGRTDNKEWRSKLARIDL